MVKSEQQQHLSGGKAVNELQEILSNWRFSEGQLCFYTANQTISTSDVFGTLQPQIVHTSTEALCIVRSHRARNSHVIRSFSEGEISESLAGLERELLNE